MCKYTFKIEQSILNDQPKKISEYAKHLSYHIRKFLERNQGNQGNQENQEDILVGGSGSKEDNDGKYDLSIFDGIITYLEQNKDKYDFMGKKHINCLNQEINMLKNHITDFNSNIENLNKEKTEIGKQLQEQKTNFDNIKGELELIDKFIDKYIEEYLHDLENQKINSRTINK